MMELIRSAYDWWGSLFQPEGMWIVMAFLFPFWSIWYWMIAGGTDAAVWLSDGRRRWHFRFGWLSIPFLWLMILEHGHVSFVLFMVGLAGFVVCLTVSLLIALTDSLIRLAWRPR